MNKIKIEDILKGNRRAISKAMTLLESKNSKQKEEAFELLDKINVLDKASKKIAITGVPGVGKSTFIEAIGMELIKNSFKVAVLAIDPSSPISGGSILGDKTRMEKLSANENAFIRPSASSGHLGGVTATTQALIYLCEAAGFDYILIETVGVGQSEYEVFEMVDYFMLLTLPNSGDELQGIKKGIMELANSIVINKIDSNSIQADVAKSQISEALHLVNKDIPISKVSSLNFEGIFDIYNELESIEIDKLKRKKNKDKWLEEIFNNELLKKIKKDANFILFQKSHKTLTISEILKYISEIRL